MLTVPLDFSPYGQLKQFASQNVGGAEVRALLVDLATEGYIGSSPRNVSAFR